MTSWARALLALEWSKSMLATKPYCYACGATRPRHENGCIVDLGLAELNFATQDDRDAARIRLEFANASTMPPSKE